MAKKNLKIILLIILDIKSWLMKHDYLSFDQNAYFEL